MTNTIKLNEEQINLIIEKYQTFIIPSNNDYTLFRAKIKTNTLSIYATGKLLIQGASTNLLYKEICEFLNIPFENYDLENVEESVYVPTYGESIIGNDEVGTGDFFGPIVVCSCFVSGDEILKAKQLGVKDSKQLNDDKIRVLGKTLIKEFKHEITLISPSKYNEITKKEYNMNEIKAVLHNNCFNKILSKNYKYDKIVLDDFCGEDKYYTYLKNNKNVVKGIIFEEKAENKYVSVAIASIIARYYFLEYMDKLSNESGYKLLKGASKTVDELASRIIKEKGENFLTNIAKMNFKNLYKAKRIINEKNKNFF